tara:strand:+ start:186 stop:707 length:522 start_codon:yes stop_codon:yes gene_type:complete
MKKKFNLFIITIFSIFCFIIFYKGLNNSNIYSPSINSNKKVPLFESKKFFDNSLVKSDIIFEKNKYYILNIWSSWCIPCKTEHPFLMNLSKYKSLNIVGLNYKDNIKNAKNFIEKMGNPYTEILLDEDGTIAIEWGAYGVPETFVIDKNNKIIKKYIGPLDEESLKEIKLLLR